jgi:hypothetical protein
MIWSSTTGCTIHQRLFPTAATRIVALVLPPLPLKGSGCHHALLLLVVLVLVLMAGQ